MLQALRDEIIVRPIYEEITKGGIIVPLQARTHKLYHGSITGEVISVGPKCKFDIKPGDKIYWQRHEGKKVYVDRELFFAVRSRWVMGKVLDNETSL